MNKFRSIHPYSLDLGLLFLRLVFGLSMAFSHGLPKLQKALASDEIRFFSLWGLSPEVSLWLTILAEFAAALFLALGLFTRFSLLPLLFTMAVAVFTVHWNDPFKQMEMALLYLGVFSALFVTGPGKYSLDALIRK